MPTETVYGLAARAVDPAAVARLFEAKGRPRFNPLIVHVSDPDDARAFADLDGRADRLIEAFWPGPLTLVAPYRGGPAVCDLARAGLDTVAVRVPAHPVALALLRSVGEALVAPSANRSGRPSPTALAHAVEETGDAAAVALDGGPCRVGLESTVISLLDGPPRLLRPGSITRAAVEAIIGPLAEAESHSARSPGRLARHYAPKAPMRLDVVEPLDNEIYLAFGRSLAGGPVLNLSPTSDLQEAAANLFAFLRAADSMTPAAIAVAPIPHDGLGEAINDRLARAAGKIG